MKLNDINKISDKYFSAILARSKSVYDLLEYFELEKTEKNIFLVENKIESFGINLSGIRITKRKGKKKEKKKNPIYCSKFLIPILTKERGHKCERCGCVNINGKGINLNIKHKDKNKKNKVLSNLLLVCDDCL